MFAFFQVSTYQTEIDYEHGSSAFSRITDGVVRRLDVPVQKTGSVHDDDAFEALASQQGDGIGRQVRIGTLFSMTLQTRSGQLHHQKVDFLRTPNSFADVAQYVRFTF